MSDNNHNMNCCVPRSVVYYIVRALNACTAVVYTNTHIHTATIHPVPSPNCRNNGLAAFTCRAVSEKNKFIRKESSCLPSLSSFVDSNRFEQFDSECSSWEFRRPTDPQPEQPNRVLFSIQRVRTLYAAAAGVIIINCYNTIDDICRWLDKGEIMRFCAEIL